MKFNYFENKIQKIRRAFTDHSWFFVCFSKRKIGIFQTRGVLLSVVCIFLLLFSFSGYSQSDCIDSFVNNSQTVSTKDEKPANHAIPPPMVRAKTVSTKGEKPAKPEINQSAYENVKKSVWRVSDGFGSGTGFFYISQSVCY